MSKTVADTSLDILKTLSIIADAVAIVARPDLEIVVHDLTKPHRSIVKIINGHISGRSVADPMASNPVEETKLRAALAKTGEPFEVRPISGKTAWIAADRPIRTASVMFFDAAGQASAMLCLNVDEAVAGRFKADVEALFGMAATAAQPTEPLEPRDVHMGAMIEGIVEEAIAASCVPVDRMSKQEKVEAVSSMHEKGVFLMRGSVEYVAKRLDVTKHTIYNYFDMLDIKR